jgi:hypothetical protein
MKTFHNSHAFSLATCRKHAPVSVARGMLIDLGMTTKPKFHGFHKMHSVRCPSCPKVMEGPRRDLETIIMNMVGHHRDAHGGTNTMPFVRSERVVAGMPE